MMAFEIHRIASSEWREHARGAYRIGFGVERDPARDRVDFALLGVQGEIPVGFVTCREFDSETLCWQFGAALPSIRGAGGTADYLAVAVEWVRDAGYKRIRCEIKNDNVPMLKVALRLGFRVVGMRNYNSSTLLQHELALEEKGAT